MVSVPTVAISNADGSDYIIINRADFDPELHSPWETSAQPKMIESNPVVPDELLEPEFVAQQQIEQRAQELANQYTMTALKRWPKSWISLGIPV